MPIVVVDFIVTDEGEFLYDKTTLKVYDCVPPHNYVGKIDLKIFKIIKVKNSSPKSEDNTNVFIQV